ncbi:arrestin domain-containing protein 3-like [Thunnus albacares]|uniref:arrestin domain-containing protein 3-like n=1 Tax=Thunnus albacares TaxID=8236 RepID=UPI001CF6C8CD|nr:arrestin domain-containing protein 3-like [Thunnus albacares]
MSPIKEFTLTYEALNEENTISDGDTVTGTVSFTLKKETKVKSLLVKVKGDASVQWSEGSGDDKQSYSAHRRYFKVKEYLIAEDAKGNVLPQGDHRFKFSLKIPQGDMPPSFKGVHGNITYVLEAKLSRKWHFSSGERKELNFVSKSFPQPGQVMCPQAGSVSKKDVQMSATINRKACSPGETLSIGAKINNSSSKEMRVKFSLQQRTVYHADGSTNTSYQSLCKMVGDTIAPNSEENVSCQLKIPENIIHTVHNCEIISVNYEIKVYLDIRFAIDPEVVFPLVIASSSFLTHQLGDDFGPYPAAAMGAPSYSDFPAPAYPSGPYPVPAAPGAYGYPAPGPAPYGFASAAFPPSLVQHQDPSAPPQFQHGEPPSYMSAFPPSVNSSSEPDGKA